ncbi:hypothetical protein [Aneurinibacillus tyrosinisolvens]|uniref:hypothetical protein n=1 Tax=Aneurinibacillus tyrosinisolvens TaxID=1443435 RepID=UPI00063F0634|nr:hypothetical protein [Aneurinibacillus tyrosinisolvens]
MIKEYMNQELIDKIEKSLEVEREIIDKMWKGKIIDINDIEETMICDIFLNYYQTPLVMVDEIINQVAPFIKELKIDVFPYIGDIEIEYFNISSANWDYTAKLHVCFIEVEGLSRLSEEQREQIKDLKEEIEELYGQLDFDMKLYLANLPEDYVAENGERYSAKYKMIV